MKPGFTSLLMLLLLIATVSPVFSQTQKNENVAVVEKQLDAYNRRDIEGFTNYYSDSVKVYRFPDQFLYQGKEIFRNNYSQMFDRYPNLNCKVINRIVEGDTVIDHESVLFAGEKRQKFIVIYKIVAGKIQEVYFMSF